MKKLTKYQKSKLKLGICKDSIDVSKDILKTPLIQYAFISEKPSINVDAVNHPKHYTSDPSGVEAIAICRHRNFNVGNAIKYLWRAGLKDRVEITEKPQEALEFCRRSIKHSNKQIEDLNKAIWYIKDEIKRLGGETK